MMNLTWNWMKSQFLDQKNAILTNDFLALGLYEYYK